MNIATYFEKSKQKFPENYCLNIDDKFYTYNELDLISNKISNIIKKQKLNNKFVGFYAHRSLTAFSSVLSILKSGNAYVPLNPKFPANRNNLILSLSEINVLIVGSECTNTIENLLQGIKHKLLLIFPDLNKEQVSTLQLKNCEVITKEQLTDDSNGKFSEKENDLAYMLFTSGSTGVPKGVPIYHKNVMAYVDYMGKRYNDITEKDKFSNTFDLTFDLSVHDMFLCWSKGACLFSIPEKMLLAPAKYIRKNEITVWFSVPSLANIMDKFRMIKKDSFPLLKYSLFCGEALPYKLAQKWQDAAPNSILENIYGPTEATIGITHYRWNKENPEENKQYNNILSIGCIFDSQFYKILNEKKKQVADNESGELYLGGSQITNMYWKNNNKTKENFVKLPFSESKIWYKTGDIVKQDKSGNLFFISRKDNQIKIQGYRVELREIDNVIIDYTKINDVVSIAYSIDNITEKKIYTFVAENKLYSEKQIFEYCNKSLPKYMIPENVFFIQSLPLNDNGKIDRNELSKILIKKLNEND